MNPGRADFSLGPAFHLCEDGVVPSKLLTCRTEAKYRTFATEHFVNLLKFDILGQDILWGV